MHNNCIHLEELSNHFELTKKICNEGILVRHNTVLRTLSAYCIHNYNTNHSEKKSINEPKGNSQ